MMQRFLGTTSQLKNIHITFECDDGDCSAEIKTKQGDTAAFQFNLRDVMEPLELEWVECPKTKSCFADLLSVIISSARASGWKGTLITLDADDKGSGKLVKYYEDFGFIIDMKEFERSYGSEVSVGDVIKSKRILKTIPMRLDVSTIKGTQSSAVRKARLSSSRRRTNQYEEHTKRR